MSKFGLYIVLCLTLLISVSCSHKEPVGSVQASTGELVISDLPITFDFNGCPMPQAKGTVVESLSSFYVTAYLSSLLSPPYGGLKYMNNVLVEDNGERVFDTGYYWPQVSVNFFATNYYLDNLNFSVQIPAGQGVTYDTCTGSFTYELPTPDTSVNEDADAQPDYVFAISPGQTYGEGNVPIRFFHCFSAVCINFADEDADNVSKVELRNIPSVGECTFGVQGASAEGGFNLYFNWTTDASPLETYCQTTDVNDAVFMLIPHDLTTASLVITYKRLNDDGITYTETTTDEILFSDYTTTWEPGLRYVYNCDIDTNEPIINQVSVLSSK